MIDVHAHFADEGYDLESEWKEILASGVSRVILASDNLLHSKMHAEMAQKFDGLFFTVGVHPSETADFTEETVEELKRLAADSKCVAIGEIGLDYHYPDTDKETQKRAFIRQIELADELALPIEIHSRDSANDMLEILTEQKERLTNGLLLHCYSHGAEMLPRFAELGTYFSFGGVTCFKNAKKVVESVMVCPDDRILTETDSPYLSPFRGEKNSPKNVPVILERIAEIKGWWNKDAERRTEENAFAFFKKLR